MLVKPVALDGDVQATKGSLAHASMPTGTHVPGPAPTLTPEGDLPDDWPPAEPPSPGVGWAPGPVTHTTFAKLTVGGVAVAYRAECTFTYTATQATTGVTGTATSTVTLTAQPHPVLGGGTKVLVDGESDQDAYGNTLTVASSAALQSG